MANYNFTVRATDSAGAYADQSFSINVQRTRIDRFAALVYSPIISLVRSTDGINWVGEAAPTSQDSSYQHLSFSNGLWILSANVYTGGGYISSYYTSIDLINWNKVVPNFPKTVSAVTYTSVYPQVVRYRNNQWICYAVGVRSS